MSGITAFLVIHVALVILVPRTLLLRMTIGAPAPDGGHAAVKDFRQAHARQLHRLERRHLLRGGLSLGALSLLSGCDLSDNDSLIDRALWGMLRVNDRIQAALFDPHRLAETFRPDQITRPFKFNAYYPESKIRTWTPPPGSWRWMAG